MGGFGLGGTHCVYVVHLDGVNVCTLVYFKVVRYDSAGIQVFVSKLDIFQYLI